MQRIPRQRALATWPKLPTIVWNPAIDDLDGDFPTAVEDWVLWLNAKSARGAFRDLSAEISTLAEHFESPTLVFLPSEELAWRGQTNNDYPPVVRGLAYLEAHGVGPRFKGALRVDRDELAEFIPHLGWLTRCNARFPWLSFIDEEQQFVGMICKHGNLHLDALTPGAAALIKDFLRHSRLEQGTRADCSNRWGRSSAVAGRMTQI